MCVCVWGGGGGGGMHEGHTFRAMRCEAGLGLGGLGSGRCDRGGTLVILVYVVVQRGGVQRDEACVG